MIDLQCCVVKFDDKEKYAVSLYSGSKNECYNQKAHFSGLFIELRHIKFGVFTTGTYDAAVAAERKGGMSVYDFLSSIS